MLKRTLRLAACVALLVALGSNLEAKGPAAGKGQGDSRVINSLKTLKYEHAVLENDLIVAMVPTGKGKTRPVLIASKTEFNNGYEFRGIMTPVREFDGSVPEAAEELIKQANEQLPAGVFKVIEGKDGKKMVVYMTIISASATTSELDKVLDAGVSLAHVMELALNK